MTMGEFVILSEAKDLKQELFMIFSPEIRKKIEHYLTRYETRRSAILPILHVIQDEYGWIKDEHVSALEQDYQLHRVQVEEVLTFYSMYRTEEPKQFRLMLCDNLVCAMMGAKEVSATIKEHQKRLKQQGKTCSFSFETVPCLGVCDGAPALLVNKTRHLKVDTENIVAILKDCDTLATSSS
jgi:NADH-quinone oxidoreductase subunit E